MNKSNMELKTIEKEIEFVMDGRVIGSGTIFINNNQLDTTNLDDEFFSTIRKNTKSLLEEAAEEQKSNLVDNLDHDMEEVLKAEHTKDYHGTDDDMSDDYESWLEDLSAEEIGAILDKKL